MFNKIEATNAATSRCGMIDTRISTDLEHRSTVICTTSGIPKPKLARCGLKILVPIRSEIASTKATKCRLLNLKSKTVIDASTNPSTRRGEPPMFTMFGLQLANCLIEKRTDSAANDDDETIENDDPESISVPLISAPLSRTAANNCGDSLSEGTTTPETYEGRSEC